MLHNRTSFEDDPDPARKRHLLRLWLMLDGTRPLAPAVHAYKGTRGIVGRDGGTTYYTGQALPSANRGI
jgi:NAD(P)H-hydrate repair Nnr-like enzyme with NAD(P)H-hydrate dehydratase domain